MQNFEISLDSAIVINKNLVNFWPQFNLDLISSAKSLVKHEAVGRDGRPELC